MLSTYCKEIAEKFNMSSGLVQKLIPTLGYKEKVCTSLQKPPTVSRSGYET